MNPVTARGVSAANVVATMLVPNTVAPIRGGPGDSDAVRKVLGYLVSPECELLIARSPSRNLVTPGPTPSTTPAASNLSKDRKTIAVGTAATKK